MLLVRQTCCKYFVHLCINISNSLGLLCGGSLVFPQHNLTVFYPVLPPLLIHFFQFRALFCLRSIGVKSVVMYSFLRNSSPYFDLTLVIFCKINALSCSLDTVTHRSLDLLPFFLSLLAFETAVAIPRY